MSPPLLSQGDRSAEMGRINMYAECWTIQAVVGHTAEEFENGQDSTGWPSAEHNNEPHVCLYRCVTHTSNDMLCKHVRCVNSRWVKSLLCVGLPYTTETTRMIWLWPAVGKHFGYIIYNRASLGDSALRWQSICRTHIREWSDLSANKRCLHKWYRITMKKYTHILITHYWQYKIL